MNEITLHDILEDGHYINEIGNGQFTGGIYSERWRYKSVDYKLFWEDGEVIHWDIYKGKPEQDEIIQLFLKRPFKNGVRI